MNLLLDIGNTRLKWAIDRKGIINTGDPIDHRQTGFLDQIQQKWLALDTPQLLAISSVSSNQKVHIIIEQAKKLWPGIKVLFAKSQTQGFSVRNAYSQPDKLGVDRWLGIIALQQYYPGNSCLVDCGTAITIDSINHQGLHQGGLICPGIQLMKHSLHQGTENLSFSRGKFTTGLSNCTESAIYSGSLYAISGFIEKVINNLCHCENIILTGGDAKLLASHLELETIIEMDFILKGLSLYCKGERLS